MKPSERAYTRSSTFELKSVVPSLSDSRCSALKRLSMSAPSTCSMAWRWALRIACSRAAAVSPATMVATPLAVTRLPGSAVTVSGTHSAAQTIITLLMWPPLACQL